MKQESDADRPNRNTTAKFEFNDDEDYAAFADGRDEEESLSYRNARSRAAARPRSLSRGAARDPRVDRDTRSGRERERDSRDVLRGLEAIHAGPPAFDPAPNVPPFPNITFGGPLHQRVENVNPTPNPGDRSAQDPVPPARPGALAWLIMALGTVGETMSVTEPRSIVRAFRACLLGLRLILM